MGIVVVKFGGTSVATAEGRKAAISHIASFKESERNCCCFSNVKGSPHATDTLISLLSKDSKPET